MIDKVKNAAHLIARRLLKRPLGIVDKTTAVRARLVQDTETKKISVEVGVRSNARSSPRVGNLWGNFKIDANETQDRILYLAAKAAEFVACQQNEQYGDQHNPPAVADSMQAAVRDLFQQAERASSRPIIEKSSEDKGFD